MGVRRYCPDLRGPFAIAIRLEGAPCESTPPPRCDASERAPCVRLRFERERVIFTGSFAYCGRPPCDCVTCAPRAHSLACCSAARVRETVRRMARGRTKKALPGGREG